MKGQLEKLRIEAYDDASYEKPSGVSFVTQLNPETFSDQVKISYNDSQALGSTGAELKFNKIEPQNLKLNFLFDGTGIVDAGDKTSVTDQIKQLKNATLHYNGNTHAPRYVEIIWGELTFKGCLIDLHTTYTLFDSDGTPLRAKVKSQFKSSIDTKTRLAEENKSSPDLTHVRTVGAGDTLPLMTYAIYNDSSYYLEVARVNSIKNIRDLKMGSQIYFPPVDQLAL